ncbi:hypothetical protein ACGFZQ_48405 [Streptomyces sp. NPDC048254]|uniref:hypothetical protein n=1 Tax=Streptomyces sp. NPDC048254 TaxID=3365525 RepID=UPI00371E2908
MHIAAGRRDGGAFVQDLRLPYAGGEPVRHTADRTLEEMTQPEVLAHIGPRPAAHIDQTDHFSGADPVIRADDNSDRRQPPWQANPMS